MQAAKREKMRHLPAEYRFKRYGRYTAKGTKGKWRYASSKATLLS